MFDTYGQERCIGGAPLNFSAHLVHSGVDAYLLSAVGDDALGDEAREKAIAYGVHTDFLGVDADHATGECRVTLDERGVPCYHLLTEVAYDHITLPPTLSEHHFEVFYFGTLALRSPTNRETVRAVLRQKNYDDVLVDMNVRKPFSDAESMRMALENATILKVSDEELPTVMDEVFGLRELSVDQAVAAIHRAYPRIGIVLVTCGADGSVAYVPQENRRYPCAAVPTDVVSTVGAGDSFSAAFLARYLRQKSLPECLTYASKISAFVVSQKDAIPPVDAAWPTE